MLPRALDKGQICISDHTTVVVDSVESGWVLLQMTSHVKAGRTVIDQHNIPYKGVGSSKRAERVGQLHSGKPWA